MSFSSEKQSNMSQVTQPRIAEPGHEWVPSSESGTTFYLNNRPREPALRNPSNGPRDDKL